MADQTISDFNPLVSVVLATFNGEYFLREQIDSVLSQSYSNLEIIISDDSSTDSTVEIVKAYQEENKSKKINIYLNKKNVGYSKNFEKAVSHCRGDYIAFCDQDDIWEPDKIAVQVRALIAENALAIFSDAFLVDAKGRDLGMSLWEAVLGSRPPEKINYRAFYLTNCVTGCTLMIHRQLLGSALPFPKSVPHDWWLAYHAAFLDRLVFTDQKLIHYRQHASNVYGVGSKIRRKRLSYYLRNKWQKWHLFTHLQQVLQGAIIEKYRLKAMYDFEMRSEGAASQELIHLKDWIDDKILGKNMLKYQAFFQSETPAFQLFSKKRAQPENINYLIRNILFRFVKRVLAVIFCCFLIILALYNPFDL